MKIALVTFNFEKENHGGVSRVTGKILKTILQETEAQVEIISFSNSMNNSNSISFLNPRSYRNNLIKIDEKYGEVPLTRIGSIGTEFEFLRYRRRKELYDFFMKYDLLIVVTGILQFANVIPKIRIPVIVQCATRLTWERKSQYSSMNFLKKLLLKLQIPFLSLQERKVLKSDLILLVENSRMLNWVASRSNVRTEMWYPSAGNRVSSNHENLKPDIKGHFISVGRFNESRKGWIRLFQAYKKAFDIQSGLPDLLIIGSGSFSHEVQLFLEEIISSYPIKILGNLSDQQKDSKIVASSYFLQTSFEEGLGLAALESLRFGVPLICSETDGSREYVINGVSGKIVPQGKGFVDEFAEAILESQSWNYHKLNSGAKRIFDSTFAEEISELKLREIISSTQSKLK